MVPSFSVSSLHSSVSKTQCTRSIFLSLGTSFDGMCYDISIAKSPDWACNQDWAYWRPLRHPGVSQHSTTRILPTSYSEVHLITRSDAREHWLFHFPTAKPWSRCNLSGCPGETSRQLHMERGGQKDTILSGNTRAIGGVGGMVPHSRGAVMHRVGFEESRISSLLVCRLSRQQVFRYADDIFSGLDQLLQHANSFHPFLHQPILDYDYLPYSNPKPQYSTPIMPQTFHIYRFLWGS